MTVELFTMQSASKKMAVIRSTRPMPVMSRLVWFQAAIAPSSHAWSATESAQAGLGTCGWAGTAASSSARPGIQRMAALPVYYSANTRCRHRRQASLAFDDDLRAHRRHPVEPLGELERQADAAMAGRISWQLAGVESEALGIVHLHER